MIEYLLVIMIEIIVYSSKNVYKFIIKKVSPYGK